MSESTKRKLKFIGCEIIHREACLLAARGPHAVDLQFLRKGLHDLDTAEMRSTLQSAIDEVDAGYDAIILGYARCSDGVVGLTAGSVPIVIPRAHDCITFFFGGREAYREYFDAHPGTYYRTTGWTERGRDEDAMDMPDQGRMGPMYEQLVAKYGKDNADYVLQTMGDWAANYTNLCYVEMGVCDEGPFIEAARAEANRRGWSFDCRKGDWTLLEKLFFGEWDEDFVIVRSGERIVARNDSGVLDRAAADEPTAS